MRTIIYRLGILSATASLVLSAAACGGKKRVRVESADEEDKAQKATTAEAKQGVSSESVSLLQVAAFLGPQAGLGVELWRGAQAYFAEVNANGGIHGRKIVLDTVDDGYDPQKTAEIAARALSKDEYFALFTPVGNANMAAILPELAKHKDTGAFVFGNFSGSQAQREPPHADQVFNLRAPRANEMKELVYQLAKMEKKRIGLYAEEGFDAAELKTFGKHLESNKFPPATLQYYERGVKVDASFAKHVDAFRAAGVDAIVAFGAYQACAGLVRDARAAGYDVPIATGSLVGADTLLRLVLQQEKKLGRPLTANLFSAQVIPSWENVEKVYFSKTDQGLERAATGSQQQKDEGVSMVAQYRELADKRSLRVTAALEDPNYKALRYSFDALEGFLNAKTFAEILQRAGPNLTRASFKAAAESMKDWDPGIGAPISFGPGDHQGVEKVWLTAVKDGKWVHALSTVRDNINKAIDGHALWKERFKKFLAGEMELVADKIQPNNICDFGKWVEGDAKRSLKPDEWKAINEGHTAFHREAAEVVRAKQGGDPAKAVESVTKGTYFKTTTALNATMVRVRDKY